MHANRLAYYLSPEDKLSGVKPRGVLPFPDVDRLIFSPDCMCFLMYSGQVLHIFPLEDGTTDMDAWHREFQKVGALNVQWKHELNKYENYKGVGYTLSEALIAASFMGSERTVVFQGPLIRAKSNGDHMLAYCVLYNDQIKYFWNADDFHNGKQCSGQLLHRHVGRMTTFDAQQVFELSIVRGNTAVGHVSLRAQSVESFVAWKEVLMRYYKICVRAKKPGFLERAEKVKTNPELSMNLEEWTPTNQEEVAPVEEWTPTNQEEWTQMNQ